MGQSKRENRVGTNKERKQGAQKLREETGLEQTKRENRVRKN